ncbi:MAG TPA: phosphatase PAP2 family protein [Burkholderiales bacterium]|nr:phosphatase PAP2 family protein [Burkholderiales bacterium]
MSLAPEAQPNSAPPPICRTAFLLKHLCIPLCVGLLLLALVTTYVDRAVSNWFYDAAAGRFPLHYNSMLETVMHLWVKYLVVLLACAAIGAFFFSFAAARWRPWRRLLLFLSLSLTLAPGAVAVFKSAGNRYCPYDMVEYGGFAPYRSLFERPAPGVKPGHCSLSGHASSGFSLLAFYFVGLTLKRPTLARMGLWGGVAAGMIFGLTRVAQGAHFLSDILGAGLICWLVILVLHIVLFGARGDSFAHPSPALGNGDAARRVAAPLNSRPPSAFWRRQNPVES